LTSSKTRPPKRLDDCTYKNASGSMTYIRDRRRPVPTRASLMNSPIKFDQLNLSCPLFPLSPSLTQSLSFFYYIFSFFFSLCIHIFSIFLYVPTFSSLYLCLYDRFLSYKYSTCIPVYINYTILLCISMLVARDLFILLPVRICWINVSIK